MQIIIKGRHFELTEALKRYIAEKIGRIERYFQWATKVEVELSLEKNPRISDNQVIEITIFANHGPVIRAKHGSPDMYASVDKIAEKLGKQVKKYKEKLETVQKETIRMPKKEFFFEPEDLSDL